MRRSSRFTAMTAVVALLAGGVIFGTAVAANADGGLDFDVAFEGASLDYGARTVAFSGTATTQTGDVEVWLDGEFQLCTAPVVANAWTCPPTQLPVGARDYVAIQGTMPTLIQDQVTVTVLLPTPTVGGPAAAPAGGTIALTGDGGAAGATIVAVVTTPNQPGLTCSTGVLATDGAWGCDIGFETELAPGSTATVTVTQSHPDAVASTSTTHDVAIGGGFAVTSPAAEDEITYDSAPNFLVVSGTAGNGVDPITVSFDGGPVACTIPAPGATWACPGTSLPPGGHSLLAAQSGSVDVSISFEVLLPEPGVGGAPFSFDEGESFVFGGQQMYPGTSTWVMIYDDYFGTPNAEAMPAEDCGPVGGGNWGCTIPQSLVPGDYHVRFVHFIASDETIRGDVSGYFDLTIGGGSAPIGSSPPLDCVFAPAGFSVSSPYDVNVGIYRLTPYVGSGGGSSGGGSGEDGGYELAQQGSCNGDDGYQDPTVTSWDDGGSAISDCGSGPCTVSGLAPGVYEVYYVLSDGDESSADMGFSYEPFDYLFRIPQTPVVTTTASTTASVILRGTADAGDPVRIVRPNGTDLCTTTATAAGTWACQFPKSSTSSARAIAVDPQSGGLSAFSPARRIPVFVPATSPPPVAPTALVAWFLEFGGDLMNLKPGDSFTLTVSGMPEGTEIEVWMHSTPRLLGTATGTGLPMSMDLTVPDDIESGPHEVEMIAVTPLGTNYFFTSDAAVSGGVEPADDPAAEPVATADDAPVDRGDIDRSDPGAPSALSNALPTLQRIAANPITIAIAGGLALALLLLVALPTELLNSSLSSNTSRLGRVYGAIDGVLTKAQDWLIRVTRSRALPAAVLVVLVAIIYGFVDPGFGFDVVSLRLVLSLGIAFFVLTFVASWVSGLIIRRLWGASGVIALQPSIILFAVLGVIVARVLDFTPGFLVGIAIGLELIQASKQVAGRAVFVQLGVVTGFSLAAWVVYSLFTPGDDFLGMLVDDTLVAVTAEGLTGALIAIFPLRFLDGRDLWEVSKRLWVLAFLIVGTAFALLVLPTAIEGTEVADYGVWLLVFAVFGLVSLAAWIVFARAAKRDEAEEARSTEKHSGTRR